MCRTNGGFNIDVYTLQTHGENESGPAVILQLGMDGALVVSRKGMLFVGDMYIMMR